MPRGRRLKCLPALAGANVALGVTLTTVSSLLAVATLPLIASTGFHLLLPDTQKIAGPIIAIAGQLVLLVPITLGMGARRQWPAWIAKHRSAPQAAGAAGTAALVAGVTMGQTGVSPELRPDDHDRVDCQRSSDVDGVDCRSVRL